MVGEGSRAAEGEEEAGLFVMGGAAAADLLAQGFELDVDLMLLGEGAQLHEQLGGMQNTPKKKPMTKENARFSESQCSAPSM